MVLGRSLVLVAASTICVLAQNATLSIRVTDPSGGAVPGAAITVTNAATAQKSQVDTGKNGSAVISFLQPGLYSALVKKNGFKELVLDGIKLDVQQSVELAVHLELGSLTERIEVSSGGAELLADSISVESTVTRQQIDTLPLNQRDFNQLVLLAPGIVQNVNAGNGRDFGAVAGNGNRAFSNDYVLDGVPNNNDYQGLSALPVSIDTIQEFKVTSGVAPAEYGYAGTQISVATRRGSNHFHGSAFEYFRGTALQARDPFSTTNVLPPFQRNQFGGSVGGPVLKNRTFFFLNYEGNLQSQSATRVATVPLDAFWKGDFSSLLARGIQLKDPLAAGTPIPGDRLDLYLGGARINHFAQALQPFWGSPNQPGLTNNSIRTASADTNSHQFTTRIDQQLPHGQNLSGRLSYSTLQGNTPNLIGNGSGLIQPINNWNGSITWTAALRPNLVNEARFGGSEFYAPTTYNTGGLPTVDSLGLKGFSADDPLLPPLPRITFSGSDAFTQLNYGGDANFGMAALLQESRTYTAADTISWSHGRHLFKAGFEARRVELPSLQQTNARGSETYAASATSANSSSYAFADFLMGLPSSTSQVPVKSTVDLLRYDYSYFLEDSWRVSSRLTVNLGLRHELPRNPTEAQDRLAIFDPRIGGIVVASPNGQLPTSQYLPVVVSKLTDASGNFAFPVISSQAAGLSGRGILPNKNNYLAPRVGFAYEVGSSHKTVIRGGYGIFYTRYPIQYLQQTAFVNPPFAGVFNYSQSIAAGKPQLTFENPYPSIKGTASVSPVGIDEAFRIPYNQQWNLTLERRLDAKTILTLQYSGNKGTHLFRSINANGPRLDPVTKKIVNPYSATFGTTAINVRQSNGNSIYNGMLLEARRRASRDLNFQANWTWAKQLDDTGSTVNSALLDVQNLGRDRANSDYTRRHQVTVNGTYDLPFGRGKLLGTHMPRLLDLAAGGWRLSGIWRYTTGRYFTPSFTASGGLSNNRPDVIAGVAANLPGDQRTRLRWFNPAAFAIVPAADPVTGLPRFGNAGRNILIGPGLNSLDATLGKTFSLGEKRLLSFRLEAFNLSNHPNYDLPDPNISNTNTVGTISATVIPARQFQFAFRLDF